MTQEEKILSMIGLAFRAGKAVGGEFASEKAVKSGKARLVIVAKDASANTRKKFTDMCRFYDVAMESIATRADLGRWTGKTYRASICILDEGFANTVKEKIRLSTEV